MPRGTLKGCGTPNASFIRSTAARFEWIVFLFSNRLLLLLLLQQPTRENRTMEIRCTAARVHSNALPFSVEFNPLPHTQNTPTGPTERKVKSLLYRMGLDGRAAHIRQKMNVIFCVDVFTCVFRVHPAHCPQPASTPLLEHMLPPHAGTMHDWQACR